MKTVALILEEWDAVVDNLRKVVAEKLSQYGPRRYDDHTRKFNLWMCFSDVYRKTLRLEELTYKAANKNEGAIEKLIDDYKDIANYAIMAVQILEKYDVTVRSDSSEGQ